MAAKRQPTKSDAPKKPAVPRPCAGCRKRPAKADPVKTCVNIDLTGCNVGDVLVVGPNGTIVCQAP